MPHDHTHDHRPPADLGPAFRWSVGLKVAYVIVEAAAGFANGPRLPCATCNPDAPQTGCPMAV